MLIWWHEIVVTLLFLVPAKKNLEDADKKTMNTAKDGDAR